MVVRRSVVIVEVAGWTNTSSSRANKKASFSKILGKIIESHKKPGDWEQGDYAFIFLH